MTQFSIDLKSIQCAINSTIKFRYKLIDMWGLNFVNDYVVLRIVNSDLYICIVNGMISTNFFPSKAYFFKKQFIDHTTKMINQAGFVNRVEPISLLEAIDCSVEFFENYALENLKKDLPEISF